MKKQITRVSVLQTAKVCAALYFAMSLPFVAIMAIPLMMGLGDAMKMSTYMLIAMPVLYAIFGFVFTMIGAWIYNLVAGAIGGIEFTTEEVA
ncbi:hypothetical protein [Massilia glaciei]|uniref:DUF3566 domain-containing protein n=1 Tax=Massilia glaciei TaxID=1524097 RepID=A0A2U2I5H0_9BURK|nr:hypothetical protein [Massilia glaciei]PWF54962.1 hypothetical protein C7C56_004300 [Massilia glaciei]